MTWTKTPYSAQNEASAPRTGVLSPSTATEKSTVAALAPAPALALVPAPALAPIPRIRVMLPPDDTV